MGIAFLSLVLAATPEVLCIGDSVAQGWAKYAHFQGPSENCRSSVYGLEHLSEWQQDKRWKVVIFNFGLWDIKEGVSLDEYRSNLRKIIHGLNAERIFFCTTTPGRKGDWKGREPEKVIEYNNTALEVMRAEKIPVIDLHALMMAHREWWTDIHYSEDGSKAMAKTVMAAIR
jgi:hypothetical protein